MYFNSPILELQVNQDIVVDVTSSCATWHERVTKRGWFYGFY